MTASDEQRERGRAWFAAAQNPIVDGELRSMSREIAEATQVQRPLCVASGRCCRFDAYGHRLYVTGLEAAWFLRELKGRSGRVLRADEVEAAVARGDCPFLRDGLCSVHEIRPFACRTFFCDPRAAEWQQELHERCHARVRLLHERLDIPYLYAEWREVLGELCGEAVP